jgi:hypothetical protein
MMMLMLAAAAAAAQPAPAPLQSNQPHTTMQMGQSAEHKDMDCCKDCCKDMEAKHQAQSGEHEGQSAR